MSTEDRNKSKSAQCILPTGDELVAVLGEGLKTAPVQRILAVLGIDPKKVQPEPDTPHEELTKFGVSLGFQGAEAGGPAGSVCLAYLEFKRVSSRRVVSLPFGLDFTHKKKGSPSGLMGAPWRRRDALAAVSRPFGARRAHARVWDGTRTGRGVPGRSLHRSLNPTIPCAQLLCSRTSSTSSALALSPCGSSQTDWSARSNRRPRFRDAAAAAARFGRSMITGRSRAAGGISTSAG